MSAGIFYTKNFNTENSGNFSWNLGSYMKVFDAELFAMEKAFELVFNQTSFLIKDIWIFSDSQTAIQRLQKLNLNAEQIHVLVIENWTIKIKLKYQVNIYLS